MVSFEHPAWLLALVVVPAAWAAILWRARAARRAARAYGDPRLVGAQDRLSHHLRTAALLTAALAIAVAPIALARPFAERSGTERRGVVVLAVDTSRSMTKTDLTPTRLAAALEAVRRFAEAAPDTTAIGFVAFASNARVVVAPTTDRDLLARTLARDLPVEEGTALGNAILTSLGSIQSAGVLEQIPDRAADSPGRILLLTDGDNSVNEEIVPVSIERARELRVPVYTALLGNDAPRPGGPAPAERLATIATQTGGIFAQSLSTSDLSQVFTDIGGTLARVRRVDDLSHWAILGALGILGLAGALASFAWRRDTRPSSASGQLPARL